MRQVEPGTGSDLSKLAFSPDGTELAAAASRETRVWDLQTREVLAQFEPDQAGYAVFAADGAGVLISDSSGTISRWDLDSASVVDSWTLDDPDCGEYGQPAFASYQRHGDGLCRGHGIRVLTVTASGIARITSLLDPGPFVVFGLPSHVRDASKR